MIIVQMQRGETMIQISDEMFERLINRVIKDQIEVRLEFTPENTTIDIQPWKPFIYRCPFIGEANNDKTD